MSEMKPLDDRQESAVHWAMTIIAVVACAIGVIVSGFLFYALADANWRKEAIRKGYAEWYVENDELKWRWKAKAEAK